MPGLQKDDICSQYHAYICQKFPQLDVTAIFYGSIIYGNNSHDLDVCLVLDNADDKLKHEIIAETIEFHKQNELDIDYEVPHINKLVYTKEEIGQILSKSPFEDEQGNVKIADTQKTKEFLASYEMRARLLLNILTTDHRTMPQSAFVEQCEKKAWGIVVDAVKKQYNLDVHAEDADEKFLERFYTNPNSQNNGENYLGYKKGNKNKEAYLKEKLAQEIERRRKLSARQIVSFTDIYTTEKPRITSAKMQHGNCTGKAERITFSGMNRK